MTLRDILTILFKHKTKMLTAFLVVVIPVTVITLLWLFFAPVYEAKATLLVKFGRENLYRPEVGDSRAFSPPQATEEFINSEIQILTHRDLIERVVTTMGIQRIYPSPLKKPSLESAIERFKAGLIAEPVKRSNVIQVTFQHKNPQVASEALALLIDLFKEKHLALYSDPKSSFVESQLAVSTRRLKEAETALDEFKETNKVYSLDEQKSLLLKQRTDLDTSLKDAENRLGELASKSVVLKAKMGTVAKNVPVSSEADKLRIVDDANAQLLSLRLKEQELSEKYTPENRMLLTLRREISLIQDFLKRQEENIKDRVISGKNPVYEDMEKDLIKAETELASLRPKSTTLRAQIGALDTQISLLDKQGKKFSELRRDLQVQEKSYQTYSERAEDARISRDMNTNKMANVMVIQKPTLPGDPVRPKLAQNFLFSLIAGSLAAFGLAFFSEYTAQSLPTPREAEKRLDLPVIATVPYKG
jgi:polysaccharide biosynthesis protein PslE